MKFSFYFFIFLYLFCLAKMALADEQIDKLTKRIERLEHQQEEIILGNLETGPQVSSFLKDNLTIGGFFEPSYTFLSGPDTSFQASNSSDLLGLNFAADFSNDLRFVAQLITGFTFPIQNVHNDPRGVLRGLPAQREFGTVNFGSVLSQGYLDYTINGSTSIEAGIGYVPFGIAAQQRELVLFIRRGGPQILRTTELLSPLWSGFHFRQRFDGSKNHWGYNLYTFTRIEDAKLPGIGARSWWHSDQGKLEVGLSAQVAKFKGKIDKIVGADMKIRMGKVMLTTEYAQHMRENEDPWTLYLEPSYFLLNESVLIYTFVDYAQSSLNRTGGTINDPYNKFEYGLGVNWLPTSYTRLRLGLTQNNYVNEKIIVLGQNRDYTTLDLSAGVAF